MQKKQTILVVASLLVVVLSVTLAYFTAQIIGKGKDVSVSSADLKIIFTDSDGAISGSNIEPGWSDTKTFTIENKSNEIYKYNIVIQDLVNTFVTEGYLQYKITSTNGGYNMTEFKDIPKLSTPKDKILAYGVRIPVGVTQSYTVEFKYTNDESVDQSDDMGKKLSGTLFITEGTEDIYAGYEEGTLGYQIMGDNPKRSTRSNNNNGTNDFATPLTATTTGTLFTSTESITGITDSPKEVYYYAGNTTNNWVKFGTFASEGPIRGYKSEKSSSFEEYTTLEECNSASSYNTNCSYAWRKGDPMYWRIIRTNHDGSIRLLYVGNSPDTTDGNIGESVFNTSQNSPKYVGYKYGEDTSLDTIRNNTTDSTIKVFIDSWYQNNLTNYTKYLSTSAVYCNDRSLGTGQTYSVSSSSQFNFAPYYRMDWDTQGAKANPSYNCTDIRDAFSVDNTSAKLTYPVSLVTSDEIAFAGGVALQFMNTPYAWFISNSAGTQASYSWWSLSPLDWKLSFSGAQRWISDWFNWGFESVKSAQGVRPVISLKTCIKYGIGDGSATNPYTILETESGC
jgi:hypothetical protein